MKKQQVPIDRTYKLLRNAAPLSFMLPARSTRKHPLLWFDEENGVNRPLRYAVNQRTPFEDEQDDNAIIEPIVFENGFLSVAKNNPVLQKFLFHHPMNGKVFIEVDKERDAQAALENMEIEMEALLEVKSMGVDQMETVARVLFGKNTSLMTTSELKRDIFIYARRNPKEFLAVLTDPELKLHSKIQRFFDEKLLVFKNGKKDVFFNTASLKKKMVTIPFDSDPTSIVISYLKSEDGMDSLKMLESNLSTGGEE